MEKLPLNTSNQEDTQSNNDSSDKQSNGPSKLDQFLGSVQYPQDEESPKIVTEEKLQCYTKFKNIPVIVEGPE